MPIVPGQCKFIAKARQPNGIGPHIAIQLEADLAIGIDLHHQIEAHQGGAGNAGQGCLHPDHALLHTAIIDLYAGFIQIFALPFIQLHPAVLDVAVVIRGGPVGGQLRLCGQLLLPIYHQAGKHAVVFGEHIAEVSAGSENAACIFLQEGQGLFLLFFPAEGQRMLPLGIELAVFLQQDIQICAVGAGNRFIIHRQRHRFMGRYIQIVGLGMDGLAVHLDPHDKLIFLQIGKVQPVGNTQYIAIQRRADGLIGSLGFIAACFQAAVGKYQTVAAEIAVVGLLAGEIAAVFLHTVLGYHMIGPFPDAAADQLGITVKQFIIIEHIAGAVAHGMGIFAQEHRHIDIIPVGVFLHILEAGIHHGEQIRIVELALTGGILCMGQPGGIPLLGPFQHGNMVAAVAAFVSGGPDDDAGMIFIHLHHALHATQEFGLPIGHGAGPGIGLHIVIIGHIGQPAQEAVGFDIRFADHIEAQFIAHFDEFRRRRVMGGADAVDVHVLHQKQLLPKLFIAFAPATILACIMVVDAMKLHGHTVDQQLIPRRNLNLPQTGFEGDHFAVSLQIHGVQEGLFRIPQNGILGRVGQLPFHFIFVQCHTALADAHMGAALQANGEHFVCGDHLHIGDMPLGTLQDVAIPENAVVAEEILVLQIAAAAPFENLHPDGVDTGPGEFRNIKFRLQMAALGKAHIAAVYIHISAGGYALQHKIDLAPLLFQSKLPLVHAAGVIIRHIRRIAGIRIIDVGIIGVFVALQLPARRHRDGIPSTDYLRHIHIPPEEGKFPGAV